MRKGFEITVDNVKVYGGWWDVHFIEGEDMMIADMASAASGIQAGGRMLNVGAHNIANAQTESFKRSRALPEESSGGGGVRVALQTDERPSSQLLSSEHSFSLREGSNVDLGEEIIFHLQAANLIEANMASMRVQEKILGSLLDITE